jgi:acetolactate synthase-1/2/3 large subunit
MAASGADGIVQALREAGVNTLFGIPSIHNIRLYEALRHEPSIRHILCRQESTAANMADGYARAANRLGVVAGSTGPGTGYMVPAIQEAWGSSSPVLLLTTNIHAPKIGKGLGVLHELTDQDSLFRNITKARFTVRQGDDIREMTRQAVRKALADRPGPVYLEVPTDLLTAPLAEGKTIEADASQLPVPDLDPALSLLRRARRPLLLAGTGAVRAGLAGQVLALAEALNAPVVTTTNGKGILPEDHPLAFGHASRRGTVREMVQSSDVCLAVGTRLRESDLRQHGTPLPPLIHLDWDPTWIGKNHTTELALTGHIPAIVDRLCKGLAAGAQAEDRQKALQGMRAALEEELREIRSTRVELAYLDAIRNCLPRESILCTDNTQLGYWAEYFYPSLCPGGFMGTKGSTTIGCSFAAAIGAKLACPDKPVVSLIGDGGFLYNAHELATCMRHGIGFPVIVVNDGSFGIIAFLQRTFYSNEHESALTNPDFVALARAYGAQAVRVNSPSGLGEALGLALGSGEMWLIELAATFPEPPFWKY